MLIAVLIILLLVFMVFDLTTHYRRYNARKEHFDRLINQIKASKKKEKDITDL